MQIPGLTIQTQQYDPSILYALINQYSLLHPLPDQELQQGTLSFVKKSDVMAEGNLLDKCIIYLVNYFGGLFYGYIKIMFVTTNCFHD